MRKLSNWLKRSTQKFNSDVEIDSNLHVSNDLTVENGSTFGTDIDVDGDIAALDLLLSGDIFTDGDTNLYGNLIVDNDTTLKGDATIETLITSKLYPKVSSPFNLVCAATAIGLGDVDGEGDHFAVISIDNAATGDISLTTDTGKLILSGAKVFIPILPTSDPTVLGQLWSDSGTIKVSSG